MYVERHIQACLHKNVCHGRAISISYSECVSAALVILHATKSVRHHPWSVWPCHIFLILSHNDFRTRVIEHKYVCLNFFFNKFYL